jgi:Asp-tRNA(Asn)/Glu-tRNA(Gln) amidotransferase C subunit
MEVNDELVDQLAHLARLSFEPEEKEGIRRTFKK